MTVPGQRPEVSESQKIGNRAKTCLAANLPDEWLSTTLSGDEDFGYDFLIQVIEESQVVRSFRLQLKGTTTPKTSGDDSFVSVDLKSRTVRMYSDCTDPILLVLADLSSGKRPAECPLYYVWVHDELRRLNDGALNELSESTTFRVPKVNRLTPETNENEELNRYLRLARIGDTLSAVAEAIAPEIDEAGRLDLLEKIPTNLARTSPSLLLSLAEDVQAPWPEAPEKSVAWYLNEATADLRHGDAVRAGEQLSKASALNSKNQMESAHLSYLRGRVLLIEGNDEAASECFLASAELVDSERYWLAWAETQIRIRAGSGADCEYSDVLERLNGDSSEMRAMRARALAAGGKLDEAIALAKEIVGYEGALARSILYSQAENSAEVIEAATEGLKQENLRQATRAAFHMFRARGYFQLAVGQFVPRSNLKSFIPFTGPSRTDFTTLRKGWPDIVAALKILRSLNWPPNVELIADVWAASGCILGTLKECMPSVIEAARMRPKLDGLQEALESAATYSSNFDTALEANERLPESEDRDLRRVCLLNFSGRHAECTDLFSVIFRTANSENRNFVSAAVSAIRSAEVLIRKDLIESWRAQLEGEQSLKTKLAALDFFREAEKSILSRDSAVEALWASYQELNKPFELGFLLMLELDGSKFDDADKIRKIGDEASTDRLLPFECVVRYCQALSTLGEWTLLAQLCEELATRFESERTLRAIHAFALDRLGRSAEAGDELAEVLSAGRGDRFAIRAYMSIVLRCGLEAEAIRVIETVVSREVDRDSKLEALRFLFALTYHLDPSGPRVIDIAWRVGELVKRDREDEEGLFLVMIFSATLHAPLEEADKRVTEMQERLKAFSERFPESRAVRAVTFPTPASPAEILTILKKETGWSDEREKNRRRLENQLVQGTIPILYCWRPRNIFPHIPDLPVLWAVAKRSRPHERQYHLTMMSKEWRRHSVSDLTKRVPIIDLVALLVLHDLSLLGFLFKLFEKVAIAQATLLELSQLASPFANPVTRKQCNNIRGILRDNLTQIVQPWIDVTKEPVITDTRESVEQIRVLVESGKYALFSDDVFFRVYCLDDFEADPGMCTVDIMTACEERGWLTAKEVAKRFSLLLKWNVLLRIEMRYQIAVLPEALKHVRSVNEGIDVLRGSSEAAIVFDSIWNPEKKLAELLGHASAVLAKLVVESDNRIESIAALLGLWFNKVRLHGDLQVEPDRILAQLLVVAATHIERREPRGARSLWSVLMKLVEFHFGNTMTVAKERAAISLVGELCADRDFETKVGEKDALKMFLIEGLTKGTSEYDAFSERYASRMRLRSENSIR